MKGDNDMYEVELQNLETGKTFSKYFDSEYIMNKFLTKCRYSKKIRKLSIIKWR